jgi:hypothetical protein
MMPLALEKLPSSCSDREKEASRKRREMGRESTGARTSEVLDWRERERESQSYYNPLCVDIVARLFDSFGVAVARTTDSGEKRTTPFWIMLRMDDGCVNRARGLCRFVRLQSTHFLH